MNLKRAAAAAAILLLIAAPSAVAADSAGSDGQIITGSKLVTAVGGSDTPGVISVRFADTQTPLFYENENDGVDPSQAPGVFDIHESGIVHNAYGGLTETSAPVTTGTGSIASPWTVTSGFTTGDLNVSQQVRHVDGSRSLRLTWTVTNPTSASITFSAFWDADLYVSGSDAGRGAFPAGPPRTLQGVAVDGTRVGLIELTPWSHYYEGGWWTATNPDRDGNAVFDDTFNPAMLDNGFGVQWDRTLAAHASTTFVLGFGAAEPGGTPVPDVAPDITQSPASGPSHSATFRFVRHAGDSVTVGYECSIDGGQYDLCTSPATFTGLRVGEHVFRVHGVNADGNAGPAASAMWTITPVVHHHPKPVVGKKAALRLDSVSVAGRAFKVGCALGTGRIARCEITLTSPGGIVVGHGVRRFTPAHQRRHGKVEIVLTRKGRALAARPGGVRVVATGEVWPVGGSQPLTARSHVRVVAPSVDVTPGALRFESGSAVLLHSGRSYLLGLAPQLAGARRIVAIGYTDSLGSAAANHLLGLARANAVCAIISHHSHAACRALSFGEGRPRATNATAAGRARNRRVELRVSY